MSIECILNARCTINRMGNTASGITATVADDTDETITVSADGTLKVGMEFKVGTEQLYVLSVTAGFVEATRGINSSTAAAHSAAAATILKNEFGQESFSYSSNATDIPCRPMALPSVDQFENAEGVRVKGQIWFAMEADIQQEDEITVGTAKYKVIDFSDDVMGANVAQLANVVEVRE